MYPSSHCVCCPLDVCSLKKGSRERWRYEGRTVVDRRSARGGVSTSFGGRIAVAVDACAACCNAWANARTLGKRACQSFSNARKTTCSTAGEIAGLSWRNGGGG